MIMRDINKKYLNDMGYTTESFSNHIINTIIYQLERKLECYSSKPNYNTLLICDFETNYMNQLYIKTKLRMCDKYNIKSKVINSEDEFLSYVNFFKYNNEYKVIIQYPYNFKKFGNLSKYINEIHKCSDVDGFTLNMSDLTELKNCEFSEVLSKPYIGPTAKGVFNILNMCYYSSSLLKNKTITVLGKGITSGMQIALILQSIGCNLKWFDSNSNKDDIREGVENSDIVISCIGKPNFINKDLHSKKECIYINVGMSLDDGKLLGDIDYDFIVNQENTLFINKVKGTTGKLTLLHLMMNCYL